MCSGFLFCSDTMVMPGRMGEGENRQREGWGGECRKEEQGVNQEGEGEPGTSQLTWQPCEVQGPARFLARSCHGPACTQQAPG